MIGQEQCLTLEEWEFLLALVSCDRVNIIQDRGSAGEFLFQSGLICKIKARIDEARKRL